MVKNQHQIYISFPENKTEHFPTPFMTYYHDRPKPDIVHTKKKERKRKLNYSISLLNINTKILNKILASIHNDQMGFNTCTWIFKRLVQHWEINQCDIAHNSLKKKNRMIKSIDVEKHMTKFNTHSR